MKHTQVSVAEPTKQKKGYQRLKFNSMKQNDKARKKKDLKEMKKASKKYGIK